VCNFARNLARFVLSVENETIKDDVIVGHGLCGTSSEQHHAPHNHHFRVAELSLQLNSCCGVARPQANARATSWTMNGLGPAGHQQKSGELAASRLQTQDRDRGWRVVSKGSGDPRKQSRVSRWCVYLPLFLTNGSDQAGACVTAAGTCACIRVTLVEPQPTRHTHPAARESLHREIRRVSRIESEELSNVPVEKRCDYRNKALSEAVRAQTSHHSAISSTRWHRALPSRCPRPTLFGCLRRWQCTNGWMPLTLASRDSTSGCSC
jgi:hypothetical protein